MSIGAAIERAYSDVHKDLLKKLPPSLGWLKDHKDPRKAARTDYVRSVQPHHVYSKKDLQPFDQVFAPSEDGYQTITGDISFMLSPTNTFLYQLLEVLGMIPKGSIYYLEHNLFQIESINKILVSFVTKGPGR